MIVANVKGTPKRLCQKAVGTTSTLLYTAPADGKAAIIDMRFINTTGATIGLSLYIGSVVSGNEFAFSSSDVVKNSSVSFSGFQILDANESLYAVATGTGVSATISGLERV
jgi:hypothetical protein